MLRDLRRKGHYQTEMQALPRPKKQILIVEDEGLIAHDIRGRLERMGHSVPAIASSGAEAIEYAGTTPFDLVLMDIRLKGDLDGIATAEMLKDKWQTPVVYLTAHADQDTVGRAKLTEPVGYIIKPVSDIAFSTTVQIALYKAEMERQLRTSEAWLSTTLRSLGEGVIATNTDGEIIFTNPIADQLTGWTSTEAHGQLLMDVLVLREECTHAPAKNPTFDLLPEEARIYSLLSKTGTDTPVEVVCFENRSADQLLGFVLAVRDIRARREMEARRIQSQRMEVVSNIAGGMASEFNNQLKMLTRCADELCATLTCQEQVRARAIKDSASRAISISTQLLKLGRHDGARPEILSLDDIFRGVQAMVLHCLGAANTLKTELGCTGQLVWADRTHIEEIFLNLALHARDAMPEGGEMRIESSTIDVEPDTPTSRQYRPRRYVLLRVTDSGEVTDKATLAHIFEPSFNPKQLESGTGLNLTSVYKLVLQNGGYIMADSEPGIGTTFQILLPSLGTSKRFANTSGEALTSDSPPPIVLLAGTDNSALKMVSRCLDEEGFRLLHATNAEEACDIAEAVQEPVQLLITTISGRSGVQLADRLKRIHPEIRTLLVAECAPDSPEVDSALQSNAEFLTAPFTAEELLEHLRMLFGQEASHR